MPDSEEAPRPPAAGATRASAPGGADGSTGRRPLTIRWINLLLLIPLIGVLVPQFYNRRSPAWGGMPFFYWYQLVWIPVSVTITYLVYRATRNER